MAQMVPWNYFWKGFLKLSHVDLCTENGLLALRRKLSLPVLPSAASRSSFVARNAFWRQDDARVRAADVGENLVY